MVYIFKAVLVEKLPYQIFICDGSLYEFDGVGYIFPKSSREIIKPNNFTIIVRAEFSN